MITLQRADIGRRVIIGITGVRDAPGPAESSLLTLKIDGDDERRSYWVRDEYIHEDDVHGKVVSAELLGLDKGGRLTLGLMSRSEDYSISVKSSDVLGMLEYVEHLVPGHVYRGGNTWYLHDGKTLHIYDQFPCPVERSAAPKVLIDLGHLGDI